MQKKLVIFSVAALVVANQALAVERNDYKGYMRAAAGIGVYKKTNNYEYYNNLKPDNSGVAEVALGYRMPYGFRPEVSLVHSLESKISGRVIDPVNNAAYNMEQKFSNTAAFANVVYDLFTRSDFTPYVMAGFGISYNSAKNYRNSSSGSYTEGDDDFSLAWNAGAGMSYKFNKRISLDLSYRYMDFGSMKTSAIQHASTGIGVGQRIKADLKAHTMFLGLTCSF